MSESPSVWKVIGYTAAAAIAASLLVLLAGMFFFGFQLSLWAEWQGRLVGVAGTIAGITGATSGFALAVREARRTNE